MTNIAQTPEVETLNVQKGYEQPWHQFYNDVRWTCLWLWASGTTPQRPVNPYLGQIFFDTTLGGPIYCSNAGFPTHGVPATWTPFSSGGGGGSVTSITATAPIQVTPSPITVTGDIEHMDSGVTAATYGDATHIPQFTVTAKGHITAASNVAIGGGGTVTSITATFPIQVTPSPITGVGDIEHGNSGVTIGTYGDSSHVSQVTVNATGHVTAATNVAIGATGALQGQEFTTPGAATFNVPTGVTAVWVTAIGGGGGGSAGITAAGGAGGGGSGEIIINEPLICVSGGTLTLNVGAAGTGAPSGQVTAQAGGNGTASTIANAVTTLTANGGSGGLSTRSGGAGGNSGVGGGAGGVVGAGNGPAGVRGVIESPTYYGGNGGGAGGSTASSNGGNGGGGGGYLGGLGGTAASSQAGAGGGASTQWGAGGAGGNGGANGTSAASTSYGAGGGGAGGHATTTLQGGDGAPGYILIMWVGAP